MYPGALYINNDPSVYEWDLKIMISSSLLKLNLPDTGIGSVQGNIKFLGSKAFSIKTKEINFFDDV